MKSKRINNRTGATIVLMLVLMVVFFIFIAFAIDIGRIQLAQLKLQTSADFSARAGAEALARGAGDATDLVAFEAAIRDECDMLMQKNELFGSSVTFDADAQISFGVAQLQPVTGTTTGGNGNGNGNGNGRGGGKQRFELGTNNGKLDLSSNSIRVSPDINQFPIVFGPFLNRESVDLSTPAVAKVQDRDIVLVVDRSTSMLENDAGLLPISSYNMNLFNLEDALYQVGDRHHPDTEDTIGVPLGDDGRTTEFEIDAATGELKLTRMQALKLAVLRFRQTIDRTPANEQLGFTAYSDLGDVPEDAAAPVGPVDIEAGLSASVFEQFVGDGITKQDASEAYACHLEDRASGYDNFDKSYLSMRWFDRTNITDGIERGRDILFSDRRRPHSTPIFVVLTDGRHNEDADGNASSPLQAVKDTLATYPQTLFYTVTFGDGANQNAMIEIAEEGNGKHFHARDVGMLVQIFEQLASNAGVTVIE